MADVFISYKSENHSVAHDIDVFLRSCGYSTWWDTELVAGERFNQAIQRELEAARCILVLWTRAALRSPYVQAEAIVGFERQILIAARLEPVELTYPFGIVQTVSMDDWNDRSTEGKLAAMQGIKAGVELKLGPSRAPAALAGVNLNPLMIVLSSSDVGLSVALAQLLCEADGSVRRSITTTTQLPTATELHGAELKFCDSEVFQTMVREGAFVEYAQSNGVWSGSPQSPVEATLRNGNSVVFARDSQATRALRAAASDKTVGIYLAKHVDEIEMDAWEFDYILIGATSYELLSQVQQVSSAEKLKRWRQPGLAEHVARFR